MVHKSIYDDQVNEDRGSDFVGFLYWKQTLILLRRIHVRIIAVFRFY